MISFEILKEEFKKNNLDIDALGDFYIVKDPDIKFTISGCCIKVIYLVGGQSLPIRFTTMIDPYSATQIVDAVLEGYKVLQGIDKRKVELLTEHVNRLTLKFESVKSTLYIVKSLNKSLSNRLSIDIKTKIGINYFTLFLSYDLDTDVVIFTDISLLTNPWKIGEIIYQGHCPLKDISTLILYEHSLTIQAKNFIKLNLGPGKRIKFPQETFKYLNLISSGVSIRGYINIDAYSDFYLVFDYETEEHGRQYCSVISPTKKDRPVVLYTHNSGHIVDYYISDLGDAGVLDVVKFISSNVLYSNTSLCLENLFNITNDNLELPGKIVIDTNSVIVLVNISKRGYIYRHSRTVQYLIDNVPSGITFLLETVLDGDSGKVHYNIISDNVESLYNIPLGENIRDICNSFVLSRYGYISSCVLDSLT